MTPTQTITRILFPASCALLLTALGACKSPPEKPSQPIAEEPPPKPPEPIRTGRAAQCPLTHKQLGPEPASRIFADQEILFLSESEASSFDELPGEKKRIVAGRQVLARQGVINEYCIVTKNELPIDAVVITIQDVRLGFADDTARTQFEAIPEEVRLDLVAPYVVQADGIENSHCPVTGELLYPGCPAIEVHGVVIGFESGASLSSFKAMSSNERSELAALVVLPVQGVDNQRCPVSNKPLRLDSPIVTVDGRQIALRNIDAARKFNQMTLTEKRKAIKPDDR